MSREEPFFAGGRNQTGRPLDVLVEDVMTVAVFWLTEAASLADVAEVFAKGTAHQMPVVSKHNVVYGIVSLLDLVRWVALQLAPL